MNYSIRKKSYFLLGLLLSFSFCAFAQKNEIKGRIVEKSEDALNPVGYVNMALLKTDSMFVTGTTSDENGNFNLKGVESGNYILSASFLGYEKVHVELNNLSESIDLGDIRLAPTSISLNEVTVSAAHYVNQIDRKIIFPDKNQIKKSTDGVDLLRNLLLSGIEIDRANNSITGARGGIAEIRINGAKASQKEIMAIHPKDVIRIEYHDEPSLRYEGSEVVIDYILRRRENGGSVFAYGQKGMPGDKTDGYGVAKMNYKKSEFSVLGGIGHYDYDDNYRTNREVFNYQDGHTLTRLEDGLPERRKNDVVTAQFGYSFLEPDKYHFLINLGMNLYDQANNSKSLLYQEENRDNGVVMTDYNSFEATQPYVNIYYQCHLKNKQTVVLDVIGDYYEPQNHRNYMEKRNENLLTDIVTNINGCRYWMAGEGFYEKIFDAGRFNIGVKHNQIYQNNIYSGTNFYKTDMNQSTTYFYAEWMGRIKKFSYGAGIGGTQVHIKQADYLSDNLNFTPTIRLGYQFNDNFQVRYNGRVAVQPPTTGEMNEIDLAIDSLQIRRGNPLLRPTPHFNNMLTISYDKKPISANLQIVDNYYTRPVMESIFEEEGTFVHMMENHKGLHQVTATAYAKASILNLNVYVRGGLNRMKSWGERYNHTMNNWFINGGIDYTWKKWNPFWDIGTRRNRLSGETISYSGQSTTAGLRYKLKGFSASAYYKHVIGWDSGRENLNRYASANIRNYSPDSRNMLLIDFVWNFQFGKKYNGNQKKINNSDSDSGIMEISR
ncbi:MAG: carboxypeptidase-like regulatory domain-containing protein [Tannerella sp.]|jgi:hypothetical protein|nr:carboxypeptidase-like regulatory domain-containing protein [Tannerella sp.]